MTKDDIQQRIQELRSTLEEHNYNYYILSQPVIPDQEFDFLLKELEKGKRTVSVSELT